MTVQDDLKANVKDIFDTKFDVRDGTVVPEAEDVTLKNGAVKLKATFLYADLAGSSRIATVCPWDTTAKIIRAYLDCASRIIRKRGGHIRSFDGDRVMGVFIGSSPNTDATKCAREIFWTTENIIEPMAKENFQSVRNNNVQITQSIGVACGETRAVRAGIRASNDLIWIGKAPSFAAKLSDIRNWPYCVHLSKESYDAMGDLEKIHNGQHLWEYLQHNFAGGSETSYRTKYMLSP
jgi:adenylate cyclase